MDATATRPRPPSAPSDPTVDERHAALTTLELAFVSDPVIRWLFPDPVAYATHFRELIVALGGTAFRDGGVDHLGATEAVALWVAPDAEPDHDALEELAGRVVPEARLAEVGDLIAQAEEHRPSEPHWYLPFIGVDPRAQGRGLGSALLRIGTARCDADGVPGYLEASSPRNRALYARHGFVVQAEIHVPGAPPLWPMRYPAAGEVRR